MIYHSNFNVKANEGTTGVDLPKCRRLDMKFVCRGVTVRAEGSARTSDDQAITK